MFHSNLSWYTIQQTPDPNFENRTRYQLYFRNCNGVNRLVMWSYNPFKTLDRLQVWTRLKERNTDRLVSVIAKLQTQSTP